MILNGINNSTSMISKYKDSSNVASKDISKEKTMDSTNLATKDSSKIDSQTIKNQGNGEGVIYEPSKASTPYSVENAALIEQLKADSSNRIAQMQSLVQKMFEKQGIKIATTDDMWKVLASGNFTADADTIAKAKEDISEDGYWGVSQTSDRIFSFALALSSGDESQMKKMKDAFIKGFEEATKSWGKELPSITKDTYDAVMKKFDDWSNSSTSIDSKN